MLYSLPTERHLPTTPLWFDRSCGFPFFSYDSPTCSPIFDHISLFHIFFRTSSTKGPNTLKQWHPHLFIPTPLFSPQKKRHLPTASPPGAFFKSRGCKELCSERFSSWILVGRRAGRFGRKKRWKVVLEEAKHT